MFEHRTDSVSDRQCPGVVGGSSGHASVLCSGNRAVDVIHLTGEAITSRAADAGVGSGCVTGIARQIQGVIQACRSISQGGVVQSHAVALAVGATHLKAGGAGCRGRLKRRVSQIEVGDGGGQSTGCTSAAEDLTFWRQRDPHVKLSRSRRRHGR